MILTGTKRGTCGRVGSSILRIGERGRPMRNPTVARTLNGLRSINMCNNWATMECNERSLKHVITMRVAVNDGVTVIHLLREALSYSAVCVYLAFERSESPCYPWGNIVEVKTKCRNHFLIFGNDHSKLRILVYSRLENQRIWP